MVEKLRMMKSVLYLLNISGLDPNSQNILSHIIKLLALISGGPMLIIQILEPFLNWKGLETVSKINRLPLVLMFAVKWTCLIIKNKKLHIILNKLDQFWPLNKYGSAAEEKILQYHKKIDFIIKYYVFSACIMIILLGVVNPLIQTEKRLIYPGYDMCEINIPPCFEILHTWQILTIIFIVCPVVLSFDLLFIEFITYGFCALEVLKYSLKHINTHIEDEIMTNKYLNDTVNQHNEILEYIKMLKNFYNEMLLIQFSTTLGSLTLTLYMITCDGIPPKLSVLGENGMFYAIINAQLLFFCLAGTILMEQTISVADEAFVVDWWKGTYPDLRRNIAFIIERSQKPEKLTVGKMADLNLMSFVNVTKNSLSIYTLLLNLGPAENPPF